MRRPADHAPYRHPPAPEPSAPRLLLRPQECADALGVSLRSVMTMVANGEIPHTRIGERCLRFPVEGLRAWVARRTTWPTELVPSGHEQAPFSQGFPAATAMPAAPQTEAMRDAANGGDRNDA
jgi:excisionase family DNA binding protein